MPNSLSPDSANPLAVALLDAFNVPKDCRLGVQKIVLVLEDGCVPQVYLKTLIRYEDRVLEQLRLHLVPDVTVTDDCTVTATPHPSPTVEYTVPVSAARSAIQQKLNDLVAAAMTQMGVTNRMISQIVDDFRSRYPEAVDPRTPANPTP